MKIPVTVYRVFSVSDNIELTAKTFKNKNGGLFYFMKIWYYIYREVKNDP
ncbi:hypothetical protein TPHV1_210056 [Treponema phagedenis]|uniref:Uncharacterized protein n=1 Tax=Treponema phagedenis TaxID=162 RepID=A0A0B7GTK0_TREPH|nr:hypothetical protein TPHV1_210056 [Treponema phagedenis]